MSPPASITKPEPNDRDPLAAALFCKANGIGTGARPCAFWSGFSVEMLTTEGESFSTSAENPSGAGFANASPAQNTLAASTPTILNNGKSPSNGKRRRPLDQRRAW